MVGYIAWLFVISSVPFSLIIAYRYRHRLGPALAKVWRPAALGGALSVVAYGLVIWAMTLTPDGRGLGAARDQRDHRRADRHPSAARAVRHPRVLAAGLVAVGVVLLQASRAM